MNVGGWRSRVARCALASLLGTGWLAAGCGGGSGATDAGVDASRAEDAGHRDAGTTDSGTTDAGGGTDGSTTLDSALMDADTVDASTDGSTTNDGGADVDAGPSDAGYDAGDPDLGVPGDVTTYLVRIDERDCLPPTCGGFFVQAVNQAETQCADGSMAAQCYVAELDWAPSALGMADQTRAISAAGGFLLDARIEQRQLGNAGVFGVLLVDGAWISEWGVRVEPPSLLPFHSLARTPLLCLIDPCFNIRVNTLNTSDDVMVSGLDLSMSGASAAQMMVGQAALEAGTLRATGQVQTDTVPGPGGFGETYGASQFYVRLPLASR
jgi:hypothetical protein